VRKGKLKGYDFLRKKRMVYDFFVCVCLRPHAAM
jgi:hypothetical protein